MGWNKGDVVVHIFSHAGVVQDITWSRLKRALIDFGAGTIILKKVCL